MEKRVEYILNCASTALGVRASAANGTSREVTDFLEVPTVRLLQAWSNGEGLQFATTTSLSDKSIATAVVFTKNSRSAVETRQKDAQPEPPIPWLLVIAPCCSSIHRCASACGPEAAIWTRGHLETGSSSARGLLRTDSMQFVSAC